MNKHNSVPNIRFEGFEDEWEEKKFSTLVNRKSHITSDSSLLSVEYENISPDNHEIHKNFNNKKGIFFQKGDILFGKLRPYLKKYVLAFYEGKAVGDFWVLSPKKDIYSRFAFYLIQTHKFYMVSNLSSGTKMPRSDWNLVSNSFFYVCNIEEQQKIGNFFAKLDKLLDLQQQKIDKLELLKKTLLQELFPKHDAKIPELRYREFEDNWIIYSFSGLLIKNSSKNKNLEVENIESISNKNGFTKQSEQFDGYRVASLDLSNYYVIKGNQFAYNPSRINVGSIAYKRKGEKDSIISPLYVSFSTKNNINDIFLWYWFRTSSFKKQRIQFSEGGVRDTLPFENLKKMRIKLPRLNEQQKIGNLLSKVDQLIELENKKLQNLQQVKKCLLQNMFVE